MPTTGPYRGRRWHRLEFRSIKSASRQSEPWDASWDHCHDQSLRSAMAPGTAEEPLSRIDQHLLYIGPVPVAQVDPMVIEIDRTKWEAPRNRLSSRHHSAEKQLAIRTQIIKLLELGVIKELQASIYRRWSMLWRRSLMAGQFRTYSKQ